MLERELPRHLGARELRLDSPPALTGSPRGFGTSCRLFSFALNSIGLAECPARATAARMPARPRSALNSNAILLRMWWLPFDSLWAFGELLPHAIRGSRRTGCAMSSYSAAASSYNTTRCWDKTDTSETTRARRLAAHLRRHETSEICRRNCVASDRACTRVTAQNLHGKEGVNGSSPLEGFQ